MMKTIETFKYLRPFIKRQVKKHKDYDTMKVGFAANDFINNRQRLVFGRKTKNLIDEVHVIIFQDFENKNYKHIEL